MSGFGTTELANAMLLKLSGVRAGTLPIILAKRLAEIQVVHADAVTTLDDVQKGKPHPVCIECGHPWPCHSYRAATGSLDMEAQP